METREAYDVLGLLPPNIFMSERPQSARRRIGASTNMLVEAALTLLDGRNVHLQGRNLTHATSLHTTCMEYYDKLHTAVHEHRPLIVNRKVRLVQYQPSDVMLWSNSPSMEKQRLLPHARDFEFFDDWSWHYRALQQMRDPFSRIRILHHDPQGWHAFDAEGTYIALLTRMCGDRLLREYPKHILTTDG